MIPLVNLGPHYLKHGPEMGITTPQEYLQMANNLLNNELAKKIPTKKNSIKIIDPVTKEVVIFNPKLDRIMTYYIRNAVAKKGF